MTIFELVTMASIFCGQVDEPRHFNYCLYETVECVMEEDKRPVQCMEEYVEDMESWKK